jgi:hypothetical protein
MHGGLTEDGVVAEPSERVDGVSAASVHAIPAS